MNFLVSYDIVVFKYIELLVNQRRTSGAALQGREGYGTRFSDSEGNNC